MQDLVEPEALTHHGVTCWSEVIDESKGEDFIGLYDWRGSCPKEIT